MDIVLIIQWLTWALLFIFVFLQSAGHYVRAVKRGHSFHKATPIIIFIGWFFVILFALTKINKFNILWLYPISVFITVHLINKKAINEVEKEFHVSKENKKKYK